MRFITNLVVIIILLIGELRAQDCFDNIRPTAPDERFLDHLDGTFTDRKTGLIWSRCFLGQSWTEDGCEGDIVVRGWDVVLAQTEESEYAGMTDWRVPNIKELRSIIEQSCIQPETNLNFFVDIGAASVWSSTPDFDDTLSAYAFTFGGTSRSFSPYPQKSFASLRALMIREL
ncbi:MAG: DUF1566 domain-containing protein [Kangiellaceae bacterium]|nr:DUF1566 domain-containing protein [Kangiellaceae bacterium]